MNPGDILEAVADCESFPTLSVIRVMCSSPINSNLVLSSFLWGADRIMMMGCHHGDCHYQKGNYNARRKYVMLQSIFKILGLEEDRISLWWVSASEAPRYAQVTNEFSEKIKQRGTNPLREEIFL